MRITVLEVFRVAALAGSIRLGHWMHPDGGAAAAAAGGGSALPSKS